MFRELRRTLEAAGIELGDEELLDVLWLSTRLPRGVDAPLVRCLRTASDTENDGATPLPSVSAPVPGVRNSAASQPPAGSQRHPEHHVATPHAFTPVTGSPVSAASSARVMLLPGAKVLGNDLVLGRALRPLKRRIPSTSLTELDEDATAAAQADSGIPNLVLRALPERWLRLAMVIDSDVSMVLWERHCRELQAVLERSGAFRQIEVHQLCYTVGRQGDAQKQHAVTLVRPWSGSRTGALPTSTLTDPSGRTLVMVITDGASPFWRNGRMHAELERWATAGPTAILHVLPRHLWAGTGITADAWNITAPRPGAPNAAWQVTDPVLPPDLSSFRRVPVPVVELTSSGLRDWATAITAVGRPVKLRLWEPEPSPTASSATNPGATAHAFIRSASPSAVRLAAHLAAMTPATVPVMRLVQSCLAERTGTAVLAEIFLSHLLRQVAWPGQEKPQGPMKHRLFDFTVEAKDLLLDAVPLSDLVTSSRRVGERIEQLVGRSPDFPAWLVASAEQGKGRPEPFARVGRSLLTRLGLDDRTHLVEGYGPDQRAEHEAPALPSPTALVLTALPLEYAAVRAHVEERQELVHRDGTRAERGPLPGTSWHVAIAELGMGADRAAALTTQLINWLRPEAVFFVGVAGSLRDDVGIGDVVVGTKVYEIHGGKQTPEGFQVRPKALPGSHALEQAARSAVRDMPDVRAHFLPIATGDVVLADAESEIARFIRRSYNDAGAIEMEGCGAAHAARLNGRLDALVIRGISDRADVKKYMDGAAGSQKRAAEQASAVAMAVLRKHRPRKGSSGLEEESDQRRNDGSEYGEDRIDFRAATFTGPSPARATARGKDGRGNTNGPGPRATTTLPPRPMGFTGRSAELERLFSYLSPGGDDTAVLPVPVFAVTGMGGVGKTALAVEAAHRTRAWGWFPGGTLFVDLRGYDDDPVTADQAVLALLDALGVRDGDLPPTADRQYDAYRALLAERRDRMLLILDNASDPAQYLPLLPGTDHHRVLITSRDRPDALPVRLIDLETLAPDDSVALVTRALRDTDEHDDRPARELEALLELTELCGHLPLALQIAAGMLRRRRHRDIASLVAELRNTGDPTAVLDRSHAGTDLYGRSLILRPVLETSYRRLPPDQARLLRLLCFAPGTDTGTEAIAALADLDAETVLSLLEDLAARYLVTPVRSVNGAVSTVRWRLHDLVRVFGASMAADDEGLRQEGEAARERMLKLYCRWAKAADDRLRWLPGMEEPELFEDRGQALAWLDSERAELVASVLWSRDNGERFADTAARLAEYLARYLSWRRYIDDWIAVAQAAQEAARSAGNRLDEAIAWNNLGNALREAGRTEEAIDAHTRARDLHQTTGDRHNEAIAWNNLGIALREAGRTEEAIDTLTRARDLHQTTGDRHNEAIAWNNLGIALREAGRTEEAIDTLTQARDMHQTTGDRHNEAIAWNNLGNALREAGRTEEAIDVYGRALEICQEFEDWYGEGQTLSNLARAHEEARRPAEARTAWLRAADAHTRANAPAEAAQAGSRAERLG